MVVPCLPGDAPASWLLLAAGEECFYRPPYHNLRHPFIFYFGHVSARTVQPVLGRFLHSTAACGVMAAVHVPWHHVSTSLLHI